MKILLVNNHHKLLGGAEKYYFDLTKLLTSKGHQVAHFSTQDPENVSSKWSRYFVKKLDFSRNNFRSFHSKITNMFYSTSAKKSIARLLDDFKPNIVHLQNIYYYISPAILSEIKKRKIPIVQTLHDYQLITPSVTLFHNGKVCEITKPHNYYKALLHKCVKDSYVASLMAVLASYLQRVFNFYDKYVDIFIAPSLFLKNKFVEYGFEPGRIVHISNFIETQPTTNNLKSTTNPRFVLFFGRLLEFKGVNLILEAAKVLPQINFKIAGDGPVEKGLIKLTKKLKLKNVEFLGRLKENQLKRVILRSMFCVVPSIWYENQPYSIMEAFSLGKPVVASRTGGIPETVREGESGLLFEPGNVKEFSDKILKFWKNSGKVKTMGKNAKALIKNKYLSDKYYKKLMAIYQSLITT